MSRPAIRFSDLRGIGRLAGHATSGITDLVEAVHHTIVRTPSILGNPPAGRTRGITGLVYGTLRGVTKLVGGGIDGLLGRLDGIVGEKPSSPQRDAVLAALNGVLGDYLESSGNPLAIPMRLRSAGVPLVLSTAALAATFPQPARHVLVLAHGLCMNDLQWTRNGHDHGAALARDLGCVPLYLHYNTGRHISANGRDFADLMKSLSREWPCAIEQLAIVGHSMGGLVARSACHYASLAGHAWVQRLDRMVFLGTPHLGSPMERAGTRADFFIERSPYSAPFARLGKVRSAGIKDLGHADLRDEDWHASATVRARRASVALPAGVRCYALAASRQARPSPSGATPRSDGLVPVDSALGRSSNAARDLGLSEAQSWVGYGMGHFDLLDRPEAYERIRSWIAAA